MAPQAVADLFSLNGGQEDALAYLRQEGIFEILSTQGSDRIPPNYSDLARLHKAVRTRKVFTVLEFGLGFSTIVMADALLKNRKDWDALRGKPKMRNSTPFQLHSVDTSKAWIERTQAMIPEYLKSAVMLHYSTARADTFQSRACHFYEAVPDIVPDFIYLDGPDPATVLGDIGGLTWRNPDRVVISGDVLRMEPQLLPGTLLVIDGRTANARFIESHFYRSWQSAYNPGGDVTVFELQEPPLGSISGETLLYCLGERSIHWNR